MFQLSKNENTDEHMMVMIVMMMTVMVISEVHGFNSEIAPKSTEWGMTLLQSLWACFSKVMDFD